MGLFLFVLTELSHWTNKQLRSCHLMQNSKILEMLDKGQTEELKSLLQDEIYANSLKSNPSAKKRYAAMKRYLKTISETRPILTKPCEVEFEDGKYSSFTNSYSLVLTKESCGEIPMCDEPDRYPDVTRLVHRAVDLEKVDFNKVLAEAKSKGYKYSKNAIHSNDYLMKYNDSYFRIGLVDITYGVLDEGEKINVYFNGKNRPITIENDLGIGIVLPIRTDGELEGSVIVEVKGDKYESETEI